jgi:hypothetical protein
LNDGFLRVDQRTAQKNSILVKRFVEEPFTSCSNFPTSPAWAKLINGIVEKAPARRNV